MHVQVVDQAVMRKPLTGPEMLSEMIALCSVEFKDKFDKGGRPYILHCLAVMMMVAAEFPDDYELQVIACGHDLFEDTNVTRSQLFFMGFSKRVIEGISLLTKMPGQSKAEYREAVKSKLDSIRVKKKDVTHNMDLKRLKGVTEKDHKRHREYAELFVELEQAEKTWN